jgi:hypothetical protein
MLEGRGAAGQAIGGAAAAPAGCAQSQTGLLQRRIELNNICIEAGGVWIRLC